MDTPVLAAAHLQGHLLNHKGTERSKIEAVKRPTVSAAGTCPIRQGGRTMSRPPMSSSTCRHSACLL